MRLSTKIFFCIITVVVIALSISGYLMISSSFQNTVDREYSRGIEEYKLLKFTLQSSILNVTQNSVMTGEALQAIAQQTAQIAPQGNMTAIFAGDELVFSNFPEEYSFSWNQNLHADRLIYGIEKSQESYLLTVAGNFLQNGQNIYLYTAKDITPIVSQRQQMQEQFVINYLIILGISAVVTLAFATLLVRPVLRLVRATRGISAGQYDQRVNITTKDEIGLLGHSFNQMADTIEEKIAELELSARQKEDFVSNFAHELKTPMTSVIGYADMIYQKKLSREETREAAGYILSEGMRLEALSLKLLDLIVLGKRNFVLEELPLEMLLSDIQNTLLPLMQKSGCTLYIHSLPVYIKVEYDLIKTLLLNLIDNSVKANSTVITLEANRQGNEAIITVKDNGHGIPQSELPRITEAFYMVDKSRARPKSSGLGLAISAKIAEIHNTRLSYQSKVGEGTSVHFSLCISGEVE